MNELVLFETNVKVNEAGMISLTDMWKAAKNAKKNGSQSLLKRDLETLRPAQFLRRPPTKAFIDELSKCVDSTHFKSGGVKGGEVFADKRLAYKYAAFIDPAFEVGVYTVIDQYFTGQLAHQSSLTTRLEVLTSTLSIGQKHISNPAREMRYWRDIKRGLLKEIALVTRELQLQLPLIE